jgi:large subunit ribosomal protein L15
MTLKHRKKNTRQHGKTTHGWGARKKHRGAGNRGGRGNAGSGKRADAKKPSFWGDPSYYGKSGFTSKAPPKPKTINVGQLCSMADRLVAQGMAKRKGDVITVDLAALGFERLLGGGIVTFKLDITAGTAVPRAIEKVGKLGGKVTVTKITEEPAEAPEQ